MPDPITVTAQQINDALDRAARYRRSLVPPEWRGTSNLNELISTQRLVEPRYVTAGFWHPETNSVKVQRPPTASSQPDSKPWSPVHNPGIR